MGDIVREETLKRGYTLNARNIETVARLLREEMGPAAVAVLLRRKLEHLMETPGVVVDGMRSIYEARELQALGPLCIVAVHASPLTRYKRMLSRNRVGDVRGWEDFVLRDRSNLSFGIGDLIALADFMIVNEGSLEEALAQANEVYRVISSDASSRCCGGRY
jgi:dephospho-CoA kinase